MRRRPSHVRNPRAAFTLVEMAIAVALVVLLMSSAILAARGGQGAFRATQTATDVETRARRALDRMAVELLTVGNLLPNPVGLFGTSDLLYQPVRTWDWNKDGAGPGDGLNGLSILWGQQARLAFDQEPGETNDGLDEDGDGLVDEGRVVLTRDPGGPNERSVVLCTGVRELLEGEVPNGADDNGNGLVDEEGFNVHRVGDVLFLRLTLEEPGETNTIVRTLETSVRLRN